MNINQYKFEKYWRRFQLLRRRSGRSMGSFLKQIGGFDQTTESEHCSLDEAFTALDFGDFISLSEGLLSDVERRAVLAEGNPSNTIFAEIMRMEDAALRAIQKQSNGRSPSTTGIDYGLDEDLAEVLEDTYKRLQHALTLHQMKHPRRNEERTKDRRNSTDFELSDINLDYTGGYNVEVFDVNAYLEDGDVPIHILARRGSTRCLELLLANGADPNIPHRLNGNTALQMASIEDHVACARILVAAGARLDQFSAFSGKTALHFAAEAGNSAVMHFLLETLRQRSGSTTSVLEQRDECGHTALCLACINGDVACIDSLINAGADRFAVDDQDRTIEMIMRAMGESREQLLSRWWPHQSEQAGSIEPRTESVGRDSHVSQLTCDLALQSNDTEQWVVMKRQQLIGVSSETKVHLYGPIDDEGKAVVGVYDNREQALCNALAMQISGGGCGIEGDGNARMVARSGIFSSAHTGLPYIPNRTSEFQFSIGRIATAQQTIFSNQIPLKAVGVKLSQEDCRVRVFAPVAKAVANILADPVALDFQLNAPEDFSTRPAATAEARFWGSSDSHSEDDYRFNHFDTANGGLFASMHIHEVSVNSVRNNGSTIAGGTLADRRVLLIDRYRALHSQIAEMRKQIHQLQRASI